MLGCIVFIWSIFLPLLLNGADARRVALVGASYGVHERRAIINKVLLTAPEQEFLYTDCGEQLPALDDLGQFALIIVATAVKEPLTDEAFAALRRYVHGGGHLLLIHNAPRAMAGDWNRLQKDKVLDWAGIRTVGSHRTPLSVEVAAPEHAALQGVFTDRDAGKDEAPAWLRATNYTAVPGDQMTVLLGDADRCLAGITTHGNGWVAYLGLELFRMRNLSRADSQAYAQIMRNLVHLSGATLSTEVRRRQLQAYQDDGPAVLLWTREWTRGEWYGPRFEPPLPHEHELVSALTADMALDEYESLQLNLTPVKVLGNATWSLVSTNFPAENIELFVQERPDPIPWPKAPELAKEFPYWLMPPEYVEPRGASAFSMPPPGEVRILWLRLNTFNLRPGEYQLSLQLKFDEVSNMEVPLSLKVYHVRLPRRRLLTMGPGGQVYGDVNKPEAALPFSRNLEAHAAEWSLINAFRASRLHVQGSDQPLNAQFFRDHQNAFRTGTDLPRIDFSSFDPWMEQAIAHNLTRFRTVPANNSLDGLLQRAAFDEESATSARLWFLREAHRYITEKGVRVLVASYGDELSPKELRENMLPWASEMRRGGWDCTSAFSWGNPEDESELINLLSPNIKLWTINRGLVQKFMHQVKNGTFVLRKDAIIGTYGAGEGRGSEHRKPLSASRFLGWESWKYGIQNCMPNPYFKGWIYYCDYGDAGETGGIAGERWVSYLDADDRSKPLVDCPFWEGIREGIEDGNLCAILDRTLQSLEQSKYSVHPDVVNTRKGLETIISTAEEALLPLKNIERYGHTTGVITAKQPDFQRGKRSVLESLSRLRPLVRETASPALFWNDVPLVTAEQPPARLYASEADASALQKRVSALIGAELPIDSETQMLQDNDAVAILIGNGSQNPTVRHFLAARGEHDVQASSPNPGSYIIREFDEEAGRKIFWIAGPDAEGTQK